MKFRVSSFKYRARTARARGVAMLLVMIALMVCMVLVTGFLSGQGTANGIARNEMEYVRSQRAAEAGVNMCMSLIRNNSNWRSNMSPGTWMSNVSVGSAVVTVTAADNSGANSFLADPTKAVTFTSTGTYNGRTAKLMATAKPTGGGTVFYGGSFVSGQIKLDTLSSMDSYNSLNGPYASGTNAASNALVGTSSSATGTVSIQDYAALNGSVLVGVGSNLANAVSLGAGLTMPASVTAASETRTTGETIPPNTTGLTTRVTTIYSGNGTPGPSSGVYSSITVNQAIPTGTNITMNSAALVHVTGSMTINSSAKMTVAANTKVIFQVDGSVSWGGNLVLGAGSSVTFFVGGSFTQTGGSMNVSTTGAANSPSQLMVLGLKTGSSATFKNASAFYGSLFAPQMDVVLQDSAQVYGGVIGKTLKLTSFAKLHWDDNLKKTTLTNVTNGSAPPGTPMYMVTYQWNPGGS